MHNHSDTIYALANFIEKKFSKHWLADCFSKSKNEISLVFRNKKELLCLRVIFNARGGTLFQTKLGHKKTKDLSQFSELLNQQLLAVISIKNERSFFLKFSNGFMLWIKCYGSNGNISLFQNEIGISTFISVHQKDLATSPTTFLTKHFTTVAKKSIQQKGLHFSDLGDTYVVMQNEEVLFETPTILQALDRYASEFLKLDSFELYKKNELSVLQKEIKKNEQQVTKSSDRLHQLQHERPLKEIADAVMANLHDIKPGSSSATIHNFYSDTLITVEFLENESPQEHAEKLYRRTKNRIKEIEKLNEIVLSAKNKLQHLRSEIIKFQDMQLGDLALKKNIGKTERKKIVAEDKFYKYEKDGFLIFIGKNAGSNEELSFRFAHKNDIWLHAAQSIAGSHVLIKNGSKKPIPNSVLEQAASYAAWYSKARNSSLVPVLYTEAKYIRKSKKGHIGEVVVEKFSVIDIVPKKP